MCIGKLVNTATLLREACIVVFRTNIWARRCAHQIALKDGGQRLTKNDLPFSTKFTSNI